MELLKQLIPLLLTLSLALLIVAAAMGSARGDFAYVLTRPKLLIRAIVAVDIIPVLAALLVVGLFPAIPLAAKAAILLMAISPVPPLVPGKALKFGGRPEYVYGLQVAMALLAIVTVPLLGTAVAALYGSGADFPMSVVLRNVATGLVAPLIVGLVLGRWLAPEFSHRAAPWVSRMAMLLVVLVVIPILIAVWPQMMGLLGDGTAVAMILVICFAILGGHVLGEGSRGDRATLAVASAVRHPGIALAMVGANHADKAVAAGVLLFVLIGMVTLVPYQIWLKKTRPAAAEAVA